MNIENTLKRMLHRERKLLRKTIMMQMELDMDRDTDMDIEDDVG